MGLTNLADLIGSVQALVGRVESAKLRPASGGTPDEQEEIIRTGLDEYSKVRPRVLVYQEQGDGATKRHVLASTITTSGKAWDDDQSELLAVEVVTDPDDDDELVTPTLEADWWLRQDTSEQHVLFLRYATGTTAYLRLHYTLPHTLDGLDGASATTVKDKDAEAVKLLCTAAWADWIARAASDLANESLGVDQVEYQTHAYNWARRARELRRAAVERLAPTQLTVGAAGTSIDWDTDALLGDNPRVSH